MKILDYTCEGCGKHIVESNRRDKKFCTHDCFAKSMKPARKTGENRNCSICGVQVYVPKARLGKLQYFCSHVHANEWQGRNKTSHVCSICGTHFRWSPSRHKLCNIRYCSISCRNADPTRTEMLIEMNRIQQNGKQSSAEVLGYALLDSLGIAYLPQHLIGGKFCVDAFIPSAKLVVQIDGDYWHGNPAGFPSPDARQKKRMRLDVSQDKYMIACGYSVYRIWHSRLKVETEAIKAEIRDMLSPCSSVIPSAS